MIMPTIETTQTEQTHAQALVDSGMYVFMGDVDADPKITSYYSIRNVPTIILTDLNGDALVKKVGNAITVQAVKEMLNK